ncbi:unnamed protein product [Larinioides sclopetarius]|uniref:Uncharacterized protein n=1 Tax=Larinioides sclopetarius TaxID=280406 RepID=A0AAV2A219_9ARAC
MTVNMFHNLFSVFAFINMHLFINQYFSNTVIDFQLECNQHSHPFKPDILRFGVEFQKNLHSIVYGLLWNMKRKRTHIFYEISEVL